MIKLITGLAIATGTALSLSAFGQAPPAAATGPVDQAAVEQNKTMAQELFSVSMAQRVAVLAKLESPDFVDHNPMFALFDKLNNVSGSAGLRLFFATMRKLNAGGMARRGAARGPASPAGNALYQVMARPDFFMVIHEQYRPEPSNPGKFYAVYTFDAFRVANGMLTEHWDGATLPSPLPIYLRVPADKLQPGRSPAPAHAG